MIDFRVLFEASPGCNLVLAPDLSIVAASDDYLRVTMTERAKLLGRSIFEAFPEDRADRDSTGLANVRVSLQRALDEKKRVVLEAQRYPTRRPMTEGGNVDERYWRAINYPILNDDGDVAYLVHHVEDVTDLVRMKRHAELQDQSLHELEARSAHYAQLLDTAPDAIVIVGEDSRIQLVNDRAEQLFGYQRSELIGEPLTLLIPDRFRPAHDAQVRRYFASPSARSMGSGLELYGRRRDGSEVPIEVSLSPHHHGRYGTSVSAAIRDVSERRRLMDAARLTTDRLTSAVDSIQDALALFDKDDRLVLCNGAYQSLIGACLPGPLIGVSYERILHAWLDAIDLPDQDSRARFENERLSRRRAAAAASFDVRLRDGRKLRVTDRRTPEGGIVKTIWDLTEDERNAEDLRLARSAAEAASAAKSEFLSSMSHELRTPLNSILGFAQLLERDRRDPLSERHRARVKQVLVSGEHLLRLIDDVLNLARIEAGRVSLVPEPVNVRVVLDEVRHTLGPMAVRNDIELLIDRSAENLPLVRADRTRFAQILLNLVSNAIKYNRPSGSVRLAVSRSTPKALRVTVRDTGMGIPFDKQHVLFQPFQRAGQETGPIEGTGIGLVITQRLARLMGGDVGFSSDPGVGSAFWVDIPVDESSVAGPGALVGDARRSLDPSRGQPRVVLYVEDNAANVAFMEDLLGTLPNTELLTVSSAEQGMTVALRRHPDVIVMDINLPGMNGVDALQALRAEPDTSAIPVIALTALASERDRQRGVEAGFHTYLTKPVNVDALIEALASLPSFGAHEPSTSRP